MNILKNTIDQLSKEEKKVYKVYASRFHPHEGRKDIQLFDLYARGMEDDAIVEKLYEEAVSKNAFYRLKNRLLEEINKTLVFDNINEIKAINAHYFLSLYHYFMQKNNADLALYYLKRGEKYASETEQHELLDLVYGEFIKLSRVSLTINPEEYINRRRKNEETLNNMRQLDEVMAVLGYRLKMTQNLGSGKSPVLDIYEKTIREFASGDEKGLSPMFRIRIFRAVSQLMIQRKDYDSLEPYLLKVYKDFQEEHIFGKPTHDALIELLIYLVNTFNAKGKFSESLLYLSKLEEALDMYGKLMYNKYVYFYYQAKVASYSKINPDIAIATVHEMLKNKEVVKIPFYQVLAYANLAALQFEKSAYQACLKSLNRVYINDFYPKVDIALRSKLIIQELLARVELGNLDVVEYRLDQVRKELEHGDEQYDGRELALVKIIDLMIKKPNYKTSSVFTKAAEKFFQQKSANNTELIDYDQWLKKKIKKY